MMPYSYLCVTGYVSALSNSLEEDIINSLIPSGGVLLPRRLVAKGVIRIHDSHTVVFHEQLLYNLE